MMQKGGNQLKWLPVPIALSVLCLLLVALWAGLARLGVPGVQSSQLMAHGPLMVLAVLGTLICLERAVALNGVLRSRWRGLAFLAPLLSAFGGVLLATGWQDASARVILLLASLGLVAMFTVILRHHPSTDAGIMTLGSITLLVGNGLWLMGKPVFEVVHWWAAFLVLTIVGERLELSRVRQITPRQRGYLIVIIVSYLVSVVLTTVDLGTGTRLGGLSFLLLAWWLFRHDVARVTVRHRDLPQFAAACLLSGYIWLGIGGMIALWQGALYAGLFYESFLHALLVGFVFSMIFGHAPIIIPALTGHSMQFSALLYLPLLLLHSSLILRIASNITPWLPGRQWGGTFNAVAILLYLALTLFLIVLGRMNWRAKPSDKLGVFQSSK
ncbi:MAG: hypothetical protein K8L99_07355 [Anaerolineae bacterium]|nr:hypothetical protein [Anaerolineae bacterium]